MRYRVDMAFHGRDFHGWQRQPGLRSVQGEVESWLERLLTNGTPISLIGAGRTDAGVHAEGMVAHFDWGDEIDTEALVHRLRVALPDDIAVRQIHRVRDDFHARYSATARQYSYRIRLERSPFDRDREWQVHERIEADSLQEAATLILGRHDFSGFCRAESKRDNSVCTITRSEWIQDGDRLTYHIRADRFLHEMVRLLVGTFVAIARGRWTPDHIEEILQSGDVRKCGDAAPAHGLTLEAVEYPPGVGEAFTPS